MAMFSLKLLNTHVKMYFTMVGLENSNIKLIYQNLIKTIIDDVATFGGYIPHVLVDNRQSNSG